MGAVYVLDMEPCIIRGGDACCKLVILTVVRADKYLDAVLGRLAVRLGGRQLY